VKKSVLLLTCSSFVLANMATVLPPAIADDGVVGGAYFSIPFSGPDNMASDPNFGFRLDRQIERDVVFAPDALSFNDDPVRPAMLDFKFNDQGPIALNFGGMDALPVMANSLGFHARGKPNEALEHWFIGGGSALLGGLIICALVGCFDGGHHHGDGGEQPCWVARAVYGEHDPRWRMFRNWLLADAPIWFRALYIAQGRRFAAFIADKPEMKRAIRAWMDTKIARPAAA
jgi:hypothetical protein